MPQDALLKSPAKKALVHVIPIKQVTVKLALGQVLVQVVDDEVTAKQVK